jgi:hypothetical protein
MRAVCGCVLIYGTANHFMGWLLGRGWLVSAAAGARGLSCYGAAPSGSGRRPNLMVLRESECERARVGQE